VKLTVLSNRFIPVIYSVVSLLLLFCVNHLELVTDLELSIIYVLIQIISIFVAWYLSRKSLGIFIMFQLTFSLFIGGRFFAYLLNPTLDIDIFEPTYFFDYNVSTERKIEIYSYVLLFVIFSVLGYSLTRRKNNFKYVLNLSVRESSVRRISKIGDVLFPVFAVCTLWPAFDTLKEAMSGGGYLLLYATQSDEYSSGENFVPNLILFFFSFAFVYGDKSQQRKYLILYLLNSVLTLLIGARGGIGALFLFMIWIYSLKHRINLYKLFVGSVLAMVLLLFLFSFSVRAAEYGDSSFSINTLLTSISVFLYTQGISLMVFDASRLIDVYPFIGYLQVFIPGATFFYGLMGNSLLPQDFSFTYHMCYELNPSLYVNGNGLGWSVLSDVYLFSFGYIWIFTVLSFLIGSAFGILEVLSEKYVFYRYIVFYIFMACMLIPRGAGLIPLLIYGVVYLFLFRLITFEKNKS